MAAAPAAVRGLSTQDIDQIRAALAAGRKPKVVFTDTAGQIAGQTGQVVALTEPTLSDDWVVVRFGHDELPFSPAELSVPTRGRAARRPEPKPAPLLPPAGPPAVPNPRQEAPMPASKTATPATPAPAAAAETAPAKPARRAAKAKPPAGLTVTLAYTDGEWTVAANQGTKALAKPYVIKAGEALKMVALLDVPGVHEAVEQIVATERAQAEQQADRLRAELAEIEARLAELRQAS